MAGNDPQHAAGERFAGPVEGTPAPSPFDPTELLRRLWQQNLPALRLRVAALDEAAGEAAAGTLTPATRASARDLAHKLAGSLGMFGYPQGTDIAREIEQMLEDEAQPDAARLLQLTGALHAALPL